MSPVASGEGPLEAVSQSLCRLEKVFRLGPEDLGLRSLLCIVVHRDDFVDETCLEELVDAVSYRLEVPVGREDDGNGLPLPHDSSVDEPQVEQPCRDRFTHDFLGEVGPMELGNRRRRTPSLPF